MRVLGLQDLDRGETMTEDIKPSLEILVENGCYRAIVKAGSWPEVLVHARVAKMKMRIAEVACHEMIYDFAEDRWYFTIPKKVRLVRNRISLALLLAFPELVSRDELTLLSSVSMGSLKNYLTKPELEVQPNIDENEEGIRLNESGYRWAMGILNSMECNNDNKEVIEDDE